MDFSFLETLMYSDGAVADSAETLSPPPVAIQVAADLLPTVAPRKRGRPAKLAPPSDTMFVPMRKRVAAYRVGLTVDTDNAGGLRFSYGSLRNNVFVAYAGPNDRTLIQRLREDDKCVDKPAIDPFATLPDVCQWNVTDAGEVKKALEFLMPAMSTDDTRDNLRGIYCDGSAMVATDGHRLHLLEPAPLLIGETRGIIPAWALETLCRALRWTRADKVGTWTDGKRVVIRLDSEGKRVVITAELSDAQFPAYRQVMPGVHGTVGFFADADALRNALAVAPVIGFDKSAAFHLDFSAYEGWPAVSAAAKDGDRVALPFDVRPAKSYTVAVCAKYLREAVETFAGTVELYLADELSPLLIQNGGDRTAVVMPMRR